MIFTCAKLVEVPIKTVGNNYLPDIQDLYNKKIKAINIVIGQKPIASGNALTSTDGVYFSLTYNGQRYEYLDVPMSLFDIDVCKGKNEVIDNYLMLKDCYILNSKISNIGSVAMLVVWYENDGYSQKKISGKSNYASFEVPITLANGLRNYFPDNRDLYGKGFKGFVFDPDLTVSPNSNITFTNSANVFVSLVKGTYKVIDRVPLRVFQQLGWYEKMMFKNIVFDFENSYFEVFESTVSGGVIVMNAEYER